MDRVKFIDELVRDECIGGVPSLKMYFDDLHIPTIGIGRNLRDRGISKEEAYHLCHNDIEEVEVALNEHLPWWTKLDEVRQRVLANMTFNMGIKRTLTFAYALALMETGDYDAAADQMKMSIWYKQVGKRAERLVEAMRSGVMP